VKKTRIASDGKAAAGHRSVTRTNFTQGAEVMNNIINAALSRFVSAAVATVMTGVLAWAVIDSTTTGPQDNVLVLHADAWSQVHVEA
jgi:hypothetical protein